MVAPIFDLPAEERGGGLKHPFSGPRGVAREPVWQEEFLTPQTVYEF
jgi:hypothetical protein